MVANKNLKNCLFAGTSGIKWEIQNLILEIM
jgi:hypothetical protein